MAEEFAKEVEKELLKETTGTTYRPTLKAVAAPPDPQRTTKQMIENFAKIKDGLKVELEQVIEEHRLLVERIDDIELAIRVLSSAQAMLDVEKQSS